MKVLIIEDEEATARRLEKLLLDIDPAIRVIDIHDSIDAAVSWYKTNTHPDLVFQDIHLADGSCFEIFRQVRVDAPVIFITAYDQYAIDAFRVNSIDYILKPVKKEVLAESLNKFKRLHSQKPQHIDYEALAEKIRNKAYQKRFVVRYGQKIKAVDVNDIAYFYTDSGNNFFRTFENSTFPLDLSLDKLEDKLDPSVYYRINRQFIISIKAIKEMYTYSKSRVKIELDPPCEIDTIASTERSGDFKKWLAGDESDSSD
ncbi:MAG: response regulator transcription factor [Bacteroidales bacterium]|nr:response regulator transcription factor [Bacteroidales bacterium]